MKTAPVRGLFGVLPMRSAGAAFPLLALAGVSLLACLPENTEACHRRRGGGQCEAVTYPVCCCPDYGAAAMSYAGSTGSSSTTTAVPPDTGWAPESWMSPHHDQWPQLVLSNTGSFRGHPSSDWSPGPLASGFLIETIDGRILAATAKHLFTHWGGVNPTLEVADIPSAMESWKMYPRGREDEAVELDKLAVPAADLGPSEDDSIDWVFMTLKNPKGKLPSTPLKVRDTPVRANEDIYVAAIPYRTPGSQHIYAGHVNHRETNNAFDYSLDEAVNQRGFEQRTDSRRERVRRGHRGQRGRYRQRRRADLCQAGKRQDPAAQEAQQPSTDEPTDPNKKPKQPSTDEPTDPNKKPKQPSTDEPTDPNKKPKQPSTDEPTDPNKKPKQPSTDEPTDPNKKPKQPSTDEPKGAPPPGGAVVAPSPGTIVVELPADATLRFDGEPTTSISERRVFITPPLKPGREYHYELRAEADREGHVVSVTRTVAVRAGEESVTVLDLPTATTASR